MSNRCFVCGMEMTTSGCPNWMCPGNVRVLVSMPATPDAPAGAHDLAQEIVDNWNNMEAVAKQIGIAANDPDAGERHLVAAVEAMIAKRLNGVLS